MNTDNAMVDLGAASTALDALGVACSREAISALLAQLASSLQLPNYFLLHLHGPELEVVSVLHNLPGEIDLQAIASSEAIKRALETRMPEVLVHELAPPELAHAVVAAWPNGMSSCLLVIGRATPWADAPTMDVLGVASLASGAAIAAIVASQKAECPLTKREIECLVCAAAGCSAKDTSRHLALSPRTVEEYLLRCKERLRVRSTLAAARMALHRGWITFDEISEASSAVSSRSGAGQK